MKNIDSLPTVMGSSPKIAAMSHGVGVECEEQQAPVLARERLDDDPKLLKLLKLLDLGCARNSDETFQNIGL